MQVMRQKIKEKKWQKCKENRLSSFSFRRCASSSTSFSDIGRTIRNYRRKVKKQLKEKNMKEQPTQSEEYDTKVNTDDAIRNYRRKVKKQLKDKDIKEQLTQFEEYDTKGNMDDAIRNYRSEEKKQHKDKDIKEQPTQSEEYDTKGNTDDTKVEEKVGDQISEKDSDVTSNTLSRPISIRRIFSPTAKTKSKIFGPITKNQQNLFRKKPLQPKSWAFPVTRLTEQLVPEVDAPPIAIEDDTGRLVVKRMKACFIRFFNPCNIDFPLRLLVHVAFVTVFTLYLLLDVPKNSHFLGKAFIDNFIDKDTELDAGAKITFLNIHLQEEMWMFLSRTLVGGLQQYKKKQLTILEDNHLIGAPRIRIVVVAPNTCVIPPEFSEAFQECFASFTPENEVEIGTRKRNHTFYRSAHLNRGLDYNGYIAKYPASGYFCLLEDNQEANIRILRELEEDGWFNGGVRAMFVDFTVYNPNVNMFVIVKFVFERASTGAIIPSYQIRVVDLFRRIDDPISITRTLKIFILVFLMITFIDLMYGFFREKLSYLFSIFTLQDIAIITLSILYFVFRLQEVTLATSALYVKKSQLWELNEYHDFDKFAQLHERRTAIAAILLFCLWMKLFKYLTFTYTMSIVATSLENVADYVTIAMTSLSLGKAIVSSFNYEELWDASPELAFFFLASFISVTFFLVLNMFVAILTDTYTEVLKLHKQPSHWTLSRFWYNISQGNAVKFCYTSALRKEGFPSKTIPLLLAKYNLKPCDEAVPSVVQKVVDEEIIGGGETFDKTIVQQEIVEIERSMQVIEWYIQFTVIKVEEYILKVELYIEAWAELLKNDGDDQRKDKTKKK